MAAKRAPRRPALTDEGREAQLISAAMDLAERQILDGTASSQVVTHFLRAGSVRERLERMKIGYETRLLEARAEQIASMQRMDEMYAEAMRAMRLYQGAPPEPIEQGEYDDEY